MKNLSQHIATASSTAILVVPVIFFCTSIACAGWMDKINQVTGKINQTSQQIDQVQRAKQQVDTMSSKLPKPAVKGKGPSDPISNTTESAATSGKFELTKTTNPIKGEWGTQEKECTHNSATCLQGMVDLTNCMHQAKGYYYRLVAARLQERHDTDTELTDDDRTMLKEDIASLNGALETDKVVDPDPEYPQRWLAWLSEEDQQETQKLNSKYMNEVRQDCDARFGGMSAYSH